MTERRVRVFGWLVVAALAGAGLFLASRPGGELRTEVLVSRADLAPGTRLDRLSSGELASRSVPLPEGVRSPPGASELPAGARLVVPLAAGEVLTWAALGGVPGAGPPPLAEGERAVALPAAALGSSALALPVGARVDLVAAGGAGPADLLVADAEVLVVGPVTDGDGGGLLLRVPVSRALAVAGASGFAGEIRVIARPPGERGDGGLAAAPAGTASVELPGSSPGLDDDPATVP